MKFKYIGETPLEKEKTLQVSAEVNKEKTETCIFVSDGTHKALVASFDEDGSLYLCQSYGKFDMIGLPINTNTGTIVTRSLNKD